MQKIASVQISDADIVWAFISRCWDSTRGWAPLGITSVGFHEQSSSTEPNHSLKSRWWFWALSVSSFYCFNSGTIGTPDNPYVPPFIFYFLIFSKITYKDENSQPTKLAPEIFCFSHFMHPFLLLDHNLNNHFYVGNKGMRNRKFNV